MISLNLLPPSEKLEASLKWNYLIFKNIILMLLLVSITLAVVIVAAKYTLTNKLTELETQVHLVNEELLEANQGIITINNSLSELHTIQNKYQPISPLIADILSSVGAGILLENFIINTASNEVIFTGTANTRDDLLSLEQQLQDNPLVEDIEVPLSNLLQRADIAFNLTGILSLE